MVIKDYNTLSLPEQWYEIWEYGKLLATLQTPTCNYSLYGIHDFYVEVQSDPATKRITSKTPFKDSELLEKYIDRLNVKEFEML